MNESRTYATCHQIACLFSRCTGKSFGWAVPRMARADQIMPILQNVFDQLGLVYQLHGRHELRCNTNALRFTAPPPQPVITDPAVICIQQADELTPALWEKLVARVTRQPRKDKAND